MTRPIDADALRAALSRPGDPSSDFDLNPGYRPAGGRKLRPAGVLVAIGGAGEVWLTKRSSALKHHPGQIAFPGGKQDEGDADPVSAALREAEEEIGLPRDGLEVLGTMPCHETVTGFTVTPVLAQVRRAFSPVAEPGEVEEVFAVPLSHLADPGNYTMQARRWRGQWRNYLTVPWGPYYIWGATARILRNLSDRLTP
ncbi:MULTISPECIES: CoA pyrophosphatase [unclassified Rhodosalinus]|uniref:NUDIX hydrolase n=1 Tax=unclassified Rhodosalinus TaxID=2630183 RepID=UPI00352517F0